MSQNSELTLAAHLMNQFEKANEGKSLSAYESLVVIQTYAAIAEAQAAYDQKVQLKRMADEAEMQTKLLYHLHHIERREAEIEHAGDRVALLLDALVKAQPNEDKP